MISPTLLLGLPAHLRLEQIEITSHMLTLSLTVETSQVACPLCQQDAHRVHSHYARTLQDLPYIGKALRLLVLVRRFFCENKACARKIFVERQILVVQVAIPRKNPSMLPYTSMACHTCTVVSLLPEPEAICSSLGDQATVVT